MLYLVAIILPPLAVLLAGKPFQFLINGVLWLLAIALCLTGVLAVVGVPLGIGTVIHALMVSGNRYADTRTDRLMKAQQTETDRLIRAQQVPRPPA